MARKFYVFYDDEGYIDSVGGACEDESFNRVEVEREFAMTFLQGEANVANYMVRVQNNIAEVLEFKIDIPEENVSYNNNYDNPSFTQLEVFDHENPEMTITYFRGLGVVDIKITEPTEQDIKFYITPKNNPVEIIIEMILQKGKQSIKGVCGENLDISVISWRHTGLKISYKEF